MALANVIAYAVVFGLPIWLVAEELIYRATNRVAVTPTQASVSSEIGRRRRGHARSRLGRLASSSQS
jgi:hypothetical protein